MYTKIKQKKPLNHTNSAEKVSKSSWSALFPLLQHPCEEHGHRTGRRRRRRKSRGEAEWRLPDASRQVQIRLHHPAASVLPIPAALARLYLAIRTPCQSIADLPPPLHELYEHFRATGNACSGQMP